MLLLVWLSSLMHLQLTADEMHGGSVGVGWGLSWDTGHDLAQLYMVSY